METVQISAQLLNAIVQYLGRQPFVEVANLIAAVQKETEAQAKPAEQAQ